MLEQRGFELVPQVIPAASIADFREDARRLAMGEPDAAHGIRDLLQKSPLVRKSLGEPWLRSLLPEGLVCVRGILFDKNPDANWLVAWHQDLTICVKQKHDVVGYGPWTLKHGVPHVQPPMTLLEQMITVRLHLDDTGVQNGALRVVPGSHLFGRLDAAAIEDQRVSQGEVICTAGAGDALLMKPLLLHASGKAEAPMHRRVVHLEFAPGHALAEGLEWYESAL